MFRIISVFSFFSSMVLILMFSGCASSGASAKKNSAADEAALAAAAAMAAMDNGGSYPAGSYSPWEEAATGGTGTSVPGAVGGTGEKSEPQSLGSRNKPAWVDSPDSVYPRQRYVAAVGGGSNRQEAERNALANLTGVFGQSIQAELKTASNYSEAVKNGVIQVSENSSVQNAITTSAEMDTLVGAEIADVWLDDNKSIYYAAAVMEKQKTAVLYADLIRSNERIIGDLTVMDAARKNTLDGYSRYLLAAAIADANRVYANVLTYVGNTSGIKPAEMKKGDEYRLAAAEIARTIPIGVTVSGDKAGRIGNAFSRALTGLGFRSGGSNSRYVLTGNYTAENADLPNQRNIFVRYNIEARLTDTAEGGAILLPYNANGREGHLTQSEAEERAMGAAEKKIANEFALSMQEYLSTLLPGQK
jgi:hypothetical protein